MNHSLFNDLPSETRARHRRSKAPPQARELRERAARFPGALLDSELLAQLIEHAEPNAGASHAYYLLRNGRKLADVLAMEAGELAEHGAAEATAELFTLIREAAARLARGELLGRPLLGDWSALLAYLTTALPPAVEAFHVLFLDRKNQLVADEQLGRGTVDHCPVYPREIVRRALLLGASAIVMAHNHPSGDPTPSPQDIAMTRQVVAACSTLDIAVHDHVIIGRGKHASFRSLGLMGG